jgi:hypothetical protein
MQLYVLPDRYKSKMTLELLQMVCTILRKEGRNEEFLYKEIRQGKELMEWIVSHKGWVLEYLYADYNRTFNKEYKYKKTLNNVLCLLFDLGWHKKNKKLIYIHFRCKKEYPISFNNRKNFEVPRGLELYNDYFNWNFKGDINVNIKMYKV